MFSITLFLLLGANSERSLCISVYCFCGIAEEYAEHFRKWISWIIECWGHNKLNNSEDAKIKLQLLHPLACLST